MSFIDATATLGLRDRAERSTPSNCALGAGHSCRRHRSGRREPRSLRLHRHGPHVSGRAHGHGRRDGVQAAEGRRAARRAAAAGRRPAERVDASPPTSAAGCACNDLSRWQHDRPGSRAGSICTGWTRRSAMSTTTRLPDLDGTGGFKDEEFLERTASELGCPGCPNGCIKAIHPLGADDLDPRASGIHQEVTGALGPNIGVGDLDTGPAAPTTCCNQFGLDPTSLGFTLSFAHGAVRARHPDARRRWRRPCASATAAPLAR